MVVPLGAGRAGRAWYGVLPVLPVLALRASGVAAALTGVGFALARWVSVSTVPAPAGGAPLLIGRLSVASATVVVLVGVGMTLLAAPSMRC